MNDQASQTAADIKFAAEAIRDRPGGVDPDALEGVLFLAAISLDLEDCMPSAAERVADNQDRIMHYRGRGMAYQELVELTANVLLATLWLEEFFAVVCPENPDPRFSFAEAGSVPALEELSFCRSIPASFVAQAYLETTPDQRHRLLARLAEQA